MNNNFLGKFKTGIIKGWRTPTLPQHILVLRLDPTIRILRVSGGISLLLIVFKGIDHLNTFFLYFTVIIYTLYSFYVLYINYHRIIHVYKALKSYDLDVRDSSLDKFASFVSKATFCIRATCNVAVPIGLMLGVMTNLDSILEHKGGESTSVASAPQPNAGVLIPDSNGDKNNKEYWEYIVDLVKYSRYIPPRYLQIYGFNPIPLDQSTCEECVPQDQCTCEECVPEECIFPPKAGSILNLIFDLENGEYLDTPLVEQRLKDLGNSAGGGVPNPWAGDLLDFKKNFMLDELKDDFKKLKIKDN